MKPLLQVLTVTGLVLVSACSSAGAGSSADSRPAPSQERNLITLDELQRTSAANLFDAIRILRPQWLRESPTIIRQGGEGSLLVYLDGVQFGDPTSLRQISLSVVQEARFLSASEAQARYGTQDLHGVIAVTTRHR